MNEIGIMQGRLVPRIADRIQAFPWTNWESEFEIAAKVGFDSIEFIFESPIEQHPLVTAAGQARVRELTNASGVTVSSVCADYFMEAPLFRGNGDEQHRRRDVLLRLIDGAAAVGATKIEIPCVDASSMRSPQEEDLLVDALARALARAAERRVELLLETDLAPAPFASLLSRLADPLFGANYDTGNSASLGFDAAEEIGAYGNRIRNIHIKDRVLGGTTVPLGSGNADFDAVFSALQRIRYRGPFILQTARDPDDVGAASRYLVQVREWVGRYLGSTGDRQ